MSRVPGPHATVAACLAVRFLLSSSRRNDNNDIAMTMNKNGIDNATSPSFPPRSGAQSANRLLGRGRVLSRGTGGNGPDAARGPSGAAARRSTGEETRSLVAPVEKRRRPSTPTPAARSVSGVSSRSVSRPVSPRNGDDVVSRSWKSVPGTHGPAAAARRVRAGCPSGGVRRHSNGSTTTAADTPAGTRTSCVVRVGAGVGAAAVACGGGGGGGVRRRLRVFTDAGRAACLV